MTYCELTTLDKEFLRSLIDNQTSRICKSIQELRVMIEQYCALVHEDVKERNVETNKGGLYK